MELMLSINKKMDERRSSILKKEKIRVSIKTNIAKLKRRIEKKIVNNGADYASLSLPNSISSTKITDIKDGKIEFLDTFYMYTVDYFFKY